MNSSEINVFQNLSESQKLHEAIIYATRAHHGQYRKGTDVDYISHPLEVLQILTLMGAGNALMIAGVLHDVAEDTCWTMEDIGNHFGMDVVKIVEGHTQIKDGTWEERKWNLIQKAENGSDEVKMLVLADKVSNLRSIASDILKDGDKVWEKFTVSREKQCWYYEEMAKKLASIKDLPGVSPVYEEMEQLRKTVFSL